MEKLESFSNFINSLNLNLKYTVEVARKSICFLGLKLCIINGHLETTVFRKLFDSYLYLDAKFCHKPSSIRDIQISVALYLRRICSRDNECSSKTIEYQNYLNPRGHNQKQFLIILKKKWQNHSKWRKKKDG